MSDNNVFVSVHMITYMHAEYIEQAINSILMQKVDFEVELIIADDNSPDATASIVTKIKDNHRNGHWIKYVKHKKNKGMMPNFIWALKECKGQYIAICEGDDYWEDPCKLQKQVDFLKQNKSYVLCFHDCNIVDNNNHIIGKSKLNRLKINQQEFESQDLKKGPTLPTLTLMFRNVISNFPLYLSSAKNGDTSLISFLGIYGKGRRLLDIEPACYRVHDGGVWSKIQQKEKYFHRSKTFYLLRKLHRNDPYIKDYFERRTLKALSFSLFISLDEKNYREYFRRVLALFYRSLVLLNFDQLKIHIGKVWSAYVYPKLHI